MSAWAYTKTAPLELSTDYPYLAKQGTCHYSNSNGSGAISDYKMVPAKSVKALKNALLKGPVSVAVEADQTAF